MCLAAIARNIVPSYVWLFVGCPLLFGSHDFLCRLTTQMFDKFFIESCSSDTTQPEIKFFNESILEKSNRSKIKLSKSSTPFLSDLRYVVGVFMYTMVTL